LKESEFAGKIPYRQAKEGQAKSNRQGGAEMRTETEESRIVAYLEGRISSANAEETQRELLTIMENHPGRTLELDAGGLEYISSAGLRVLMLLARKQNNTLTVRNVTPEVYEILEMTGFTSILNVKKKLRELSVEGCEIIGRGAVGTVYRIDEDTIVKVYEMPDSIPMIENEQKRAKQAFLKGIPTAISYDVVKVGEHYGSVFELLKATDYNDLIREAPERKEEIVREYADFLRQIHSIEMDGEELPEAKTVFLGYLDALGSVLPEDLGLRLRGLLEAMPENLHFIHGDIHMKNVMLSADEPLLIDMETLCVGDPVFDLQGLYVTYKAFGEDDPDNAMEFLGIPDELADYIWKRTLDFYCSDRDAASRPELEAKIRILAYVNFLYLLTVLDVGREDLMPIRIKHTLEHLRELAGRVDSLAIGI